MSNNPIFEYDESSSERLARKSKEVPIFPIAVGGLSIACAYGAYKYKHRGKMDTSVFLMQLRVGAQGVAVALLCAGLGYTLLQKHLHPKDSEPKK